MAMDRRIWCAIFLACLVACTLQGFRAEEAESDGEKLVDGGINTGHSGETDTATSEREKEAVAPKARSFRGGAEKFEFQAEVHRLMDIIINSLYSNKDIFLRELISNASDALDKLRFLALTDKSLLGEGEDANLEIRISIDKEKKILSIRDRGVGMTKADLVNNLGTIAKSGTSAFLEQMQKGGDINLIGQFGVGFYSVYLVADYVEVISKHNDDKQYIWESNAGGDYAISEDTENEPLGRGTLIKIYLKEETQEYLEESKVTELVTKYSEFMNYPIYLWTTKEVEKEVPADEDEEEPAEDKTEAEEEKEDEKDDEEGDDVEDEEDEEEEKPKTKKVKETVSEWEQVNKNKAIWLRDPSEVTKDEYENFYKSVAKATDAPLATAHFKAEGDVEFRSILFIPSKAPSDFMDSYYAKKALLKLYVRRVFISDEFEDLIPRYLSFMKGLVDSDTLPLSVSRETLQQHSSLKTIKKKLVRKALDIIKKLADLEKKAEEGGDDAVEEDKTKYTTFWNEFGKAIKLGVIEDTANRNRLAKLIRFHTSKSPDKLTSLDDYISRKKEGQKTIYYLIGQTQEELEKSPFLESLLAAGYEVVYFTSPIDEYLMQNLKEYEDLQFQNASKEDLKLGEKEPKDKKKDKAVKESFKDLLKWWKELLGSHVESVKISKRLATTPTVVVTSKWGWSANMERIMKAQAMSDSDKQSYMKGQKSLEINPRHPLVAELKEMHSADPESEKAKTLGRLLFETALLESGFTIEDPKSFNSRVYSLVKDALGIKGDLTMEAPEAPEAEEEVEEEAPKEEEVVEAASDSKDEL